MMSTDWILYICSFTLMVLLCFFGDLTFEWELSLEQLTTLIPFYLLLHMAFYCMRLSSSSSSQSSGSTPGLHVGACRYMSWGLEFLGDLLGWSPQNLILWSSCAWSSAMNLYCTIVYWVHHMKLLFVFLELYLSNGFKVSYWSKTKWVNKGVFLGSLYYLYYINFV